MTDFSTAETLTGLGIQQARTRLGLDPSQFARTCGVSTTTVGRWESAGVHRVYPDTFQHDLLVALTSHVRSFTEHDATRLGNAVARTLAVYGNLRALYVLLHELLGIAG
jgi:transcriptional regulator with XRE-family HTH domain